MSDKVFVDGLGVVRDKHTGEPLEDVGALKQRIDQLEKALREINSRASDFDDSVQIILQDIRTISFRALNTDKGDKNA